MNPASTIANAKPVLGDPRKLQENPECSRPNAGLAADGVSS